MSRDLDKALRLLGLASRAGRAVSGFEVCGQKIRYGKATLLWLAEDGAAATQEKLQRLARQQKVPVIVTAHKEDLGRFTGRGQAAAVVLLDASLAKAIQGCVKTTE